jgi:hypothetical protein
MAINKEIPNIIRIGIIYDNQIIRERLVLPNESVTIGKSGNSMFTIDVSFDSFEILEAKGEGLYTLKFIDGMDGYVKSSDGVDYDLSQLRMERIASFKKDIYVYDVSENYLGKIVIEDKYTILFQFIKSPPLALKEEFSFDPEFVGDDDIIFLGFWGLFSSFALVMLFWIDTVDPPKQSTEEIQERIAEMLNVELPEEEEKLEVEEVDDEPEDPEENTEVDPDAVSDKPEDVPEEAAEEAPSDTPEEQEVAEEVEREVAASNASAEDVAAAEEAIANSALIGLLATRGSSGAGVVSSAFDGSGADTNLDEALKNVTSGKVASSADKLAFEGATDNSGRAKSASGVSKGSSNAKGVKASSGAKSSGPVKGKMKAKTNLATASEECVASIKKVVKKNRKQVKFCYDNELKSNPTLQGKLVLEFAIKGGGVKNFKVVKNTTKSKTLSICVEKKVTKWKFPGNCSEDLARLPFSLFPQ